MALDELLISTGVDNLIRLIHDRGRVELASAVKELGLQQETVESWAHVLEEEGIIKIEYKLTKAYLVWVQPTKQQIDSKAQSLSSEKTQVVENIKDTLHKVQDAKGEMIVLGNNFKEIYKNLDPRTSKLPERLQELKKSEAALDSIYEKYANRISKIRGGLKGIEKQIDDIENGMMSKPKIAVVLNEVNDNLQKTRNEYTTFSASLESELSKFEGDVLSSKVEIEEEIKKATQLVEQLDAASKHKEEVSAAVEEIERLSTQREGLEEKLANLTKKAQILELQSRNTQMEKMVDSKVHEIEEKYAMTQKETAEFDEKRTELRSLIKKIWEEAA